MPQLLFNIVKEEENKYHSKAILPLLFRSSFLNMTLISRYNIFILFSEKMEHYIC